MPRDGRLETAVTLFLAELAPELASAHDELYPMRVDEHIPLSLTLLYPFAPRDELTAEHVERLRAFFASQPRPTFEIARVAQWEEGGAVYGVPEPEVELRATMRALWGLFPEHPPYGGAEDPPPHASLTLDGGADRAETLARVEKRLEGLLPVSFDVGEAVLMEEYEPDVWRGVYAFPFQT